MGVSQPVLIRPSCPAPLAFLLIALPYISAALMSYPASLPQHHLAALAFSCMPELVVGYGVGYPKSDLMFCWDMIEIRGGVLHLYQLWEVSMFISLFLPDIKILPLLTILRYTRNNTLLIQDRPSKMLYL